MYELRDNGGEVIATGETIAFDDDSISIGGLTLNGATNIHLFKDGVEVSIAEEKADVDSDYENWSNRKLKVTIKLLVKEINKLRALHDLNEYTKEQVEAALKAEM